MYNTLIGQNRVFKAAIYIRLSEADEGKAYESDSESVLNQRNILMKFVKDNNFIFVDEYVDDGYSGTDFERPGFMRMIEDIKNKEVNLVIVKDLSRLGRDHIMTGYYIETFFPENGIRFISLQEGYDNAVNQASNDSSTFIIACNDYYSKQNSIKIRNVLNDKRRNGKFIGSAPCYGYMRDPEDKGHLIPDPETANIVKQIFEWRRNDIGVSEIATRLTNLGVKTPAGYKNIKYSSRLKEKKEWTIHSVIKILSNRMYVGDMVQHTQTKVNYKSRKKITLNENLWVIVENTHEPLVDRDIFKLVNHKKNNNNRTVSIKTDREKRLLEGLIYCKECGNRLGVLHRKNHNYWSINCNRYARDPVRRKCTSHFFPYEYFEGQILKQIYIHFSELFGELNVDELNNEIIKRTSKENNMYHENIQILEQEKAKIFKSIELLYSDRIDGTLSADSYKLLSNNYELKLKEINKKIGDINIKILNNKLNSCEIPDYTNKINKLLNIKSPNRDLIFTLVEKIEADKDRNIYISFRHKIIADLIFKYQDENKPRNPYGRKGKNCIL